MQKSLNTRQKCKIIANTFESRLQLHFEDNRTNYIQAEIEELLGRHPGFKYKRSEGINKHIDAENIKMAVSRSNALLPDGDTISCKKELPSTCLHLLVGELIKK